MKNGLVYLLILLFALSCKPTNNQVLVFTKTEGYRHKSIETGTQAIISYLAANGIKALATEEAQLFTEKNLSSYAAVIFLNTTGDVLDDTQQLAFQKYIQRGGGFVGIHAATDTEYEWPWYNQLVGAYFESHPQIQEATLSCVKVDDPCCQHLPEAWQLKDEWYNFKAMNPNLEVIMEIDETSYEGGKHGAKHPMVWKHAYDGGRSFYTAIGHRNETFQNEDYLLQLYEGILYAMGSPKRKRGTSTLSTL